MSLGGPVNNHYTVYYSTRRQYDYDFGNERICPLLLGPGTLATSCKTTTVQNVHHDVRKNRQLAIGTDKRS